MMQRLCRCLYFRRDRYAGVGGRMVHPKRCAWHVENFYIDPDNGKNVLCEGSKIKELYFGPLIAYALRGLH